MCCWATWLNAQKINWEGRPGCATGPVQQTFSPFFLFPFRLDAVHNLKQRKRPVYLLCLLSELNDWVRNQDNGTEECGEGQEILVRVVPCGVGRCFTGPHDVVATPGLLQAQVRHPPQRSQSRSTSTSTSHRPPSKLKLSTQSLILSPSPNFIIFCFISWFPLYIIVMIIH